MSALLVTGGAGFIGANFVRFWRQAHPGDRVVVLDAMTYAAQPDSIGECIAPPSCRLVRGNICDQALVEQLLRSDDITRIVHFAAESHVDRSISGPDPFIETNIIGTYTLLKAARAVWDERDGAECRFHHISTDEVFGSLSPEAPAFTEHSAYSPNSTYSASKASSDHLVRAFHKTHGLPVTTSNCSNNYGPLQFPEKLIPLAITNLVQGKNVPVYGDGRNVRDWLHVADHCRGIESVLLHGRVGQTYNIGGNAEWANIDLIHELCSVIDTVFFEDERYAQRYPDAAPVGGGRCADLIEFVTDRPGHDRRYAIDASKARNELGFSPQWDFRDGLMQTARWYLDNPHWWQPILDGSYVNR